MTRLLNLGCGGVFHPAWVNLDARPVSPGIVAWDVRRGLPFPCAHFDAVYGSHLLEHLDRPDAATLLGECLRVLKPAGVLRLVVPDLEAIARLYLDSLGDALSGDAGAAWRYDWAMIELYDQTVRTASGGEMAKALSAGLNDEQRAFVEQRIGAEVFGPRPGPRPLLRTIGAAIRKARRRIAAGAAHLALGPEGSEALREGLFRRSGEVHRWMYDRYSLRRVLQEAGFVETRTRVAGDSAIPGFAGHGLELCNGRERKPDSLYVEASKPRSEQRDSS